MRLIQTCFALTLAALIAQSSAHAAVIGTIVPAEPVTAERIATLPAPQQAAWIAYLNRSNEQAAAEKAAVDAELKSAKTSPPPVDGSPKSMPLDRQAAWYAGAEARHIADVIVSFQSPSGGWAKNQDRSGAVRAPGQAYVTGSLYPAATLDNGATTSELEFLALVATQAPGPEGDSYRKSFLRGVEYMLGAQYPNGGWPQYWPLAGSYHDALTYNDDAMVSVVELLRMVSLGKDQYAFTPEPEPEPVRKRAAAAVVRALDVILATQVVVDGKKTVWGQQHDALTLQPVGARNYEPAALSASESANLLVYLMAQPTPSPAIIDAVHSGVAWLRSTAISDHIFTDGGDPVKGRLLVSKPGAPLIWARFYSTDKKPRFGDRDKSLHDTVDGVSAGRRNGYSWYNSTPQRALKAYEAWSKARPAP